MYLNLAMYNILMLTIRFFQHPNIDTATSSLNSNGEESVTPDSKDVLDHHCLMPGGVFTEAIFSVFRSG